MVERAHPGRGPQPRGRLARQLGIENDDLRLQPLVADPALFALGFIGHAAERGEFSRRKSGRHRDVWQLGSGRLFAQQAHRGDLDGVYRAAAPEADE